MKTPRAQAYAIVRRYGDPDVLRGGSRAAEVVVARNRAMRDIEEELGWNVERIAQFFNVHRNTISSARRNPR
jgi:hypothetical protein